MRKILIPPRVVLALLLISIGVGLAAPIFGPLAWPVRVIGVLLIPPALAINITSAGRFRRLGTLVGVALAVGSLTAWIGPIGYYLYSRLWIIPYEEARMVEHFGDDYRAFQRRVPRWLGVVRS